jgi:hypothetical protein
MNANPSLDSAKRSVAVAATLWRAGFMPECHAAMRSALRAALAAWAPSESSNDEEAVAGEERALAALAQRGYGRVEALRAALVASRRLETPRATAAPPTPTDFESLGSEVERLVRYSETHLRPAHLRRRRRLLARVALGASVLLVLVLGYRLWGRVRVRASDAYSPSAPASYAVDGLDNTEWLLPDRALGWIDVYLPRSRHIRRVQVLNGHNRAYLDRATQRFRVTAYADDHPLATAEGEFARIKPGRSEVTVKLDARGATRLRLEVLSFFGTGAAIAEIEAE